jgi:adenosylcobyric acid synthase
MEWRDRAAQLWPTVRGCLDELMREYDVLVIEGAGSPAEINLQTTDIVNMRVAEAARAATLLICDIDRGGAFAHLYGTYRLLPESQRALIRGFVLNKFRGDERLLAPGPEMLERLTGVPTLGVLPLWRDHGLPEEDGVLDAPAAGVGINVAIVAYPRISNLDEFAPLRRVPGIALSWARQTQTVGAADLLILPGSKHVAADLAWLRASGLDTAIRRHIEAGKPVLAICGGLQMLGAAITDPHGVEGSSTGLGVLPIATEFQPAKRYRRDRYAFASLTGYWAPLSGLCFDAYEIRHGKTEPLPLQSSQIAVSSVLPDDAGFQCRGILALYTHGLFENAGVLRALFGAQVPSLDDTFEGLADFVDRYLGAEPLSALLRP